MRTTLFIEDSLLQAAKFCAARERVSVSDVINEILREAFTTRVSEPQLPEHRPHTFGNPAIIHAMEPAELAALVYRDDLAAIDP